eukprot:CAMPEP_0195014192 /NCGR_PEP_ID=MMETSP0326_2-20130528/15442_1 /TAXON_ID=2866 ORGANISM="Crypthecodinium cohnii, Strain Seligo" /NCGR_SAMPLE_ID=MMETSP0326_2 /ASSEMBLY_ACC=CAM_ASM_000348 /LENGTH=79 /DNA_ID=CAMNT_0040026277 /DNA_START=74 /DNA_END=310 /DNA_ORIENTATION=-
MSSLEEKEMQDFGSHVGAGKSARFRAKSSSRSMAAAGAEFATAADATCLTQSIGLDTLRTRDPGRRRPVGHPDQGAHHS